MITSKRIKSAQEAFVWLWLPGKTQPVVAGYIKKIDEMYQFNYGRLFLENAEAIPLSPFELPLNSEIFVPQGINIIHSCLRDAAPDAWGRRLIDYQCNSINPNELDYMLLSGSNRIGALDFQASSTEYIPREINNINIEDFLSAAEKIEKNQILPEELEPLLLRGTSIGGARPKALILDDHVGYIAKFGLSTDMHNVIKSEFVAMKLAKLVGLNVANVKLHSVLGKNILLVERFDRYPTDNGMARHLMLSGLSLLGLNEMEARYASYPGFADIIRKQFTYPKKDLKELYQRLIFNILVGNTDDHARNTSAFWDGSHLQLTPAYDLCPQMRAGQIATQAMALNGIARNYSTLNNVLSISGSFQINYKDALMLIENMVAMIKKNWISVCEEADMTIRERERLWTRVIFNPFCFEDWSDKKFKVP